MFMQQAEAARAAAEREVVAVANDLPDPVAENELDVENADNYDPNDAGSIQR
jgi:hypothetical protein